MARTRLRLLATVSIVLALAFCSSLGGVAATEEEVPGEPASFYGEAIEADGTEIPAGVSIVAVVNGSVEGEITVESSGTYGGPGAFDEKLRVDSAAGDDLTFRLAGPNGSIGGTAALKAEVVEKNLTFPDGSIDRLPPIPAIEMDPEVASVGDPVTFSAANSTAYEDAEITAFEWSIERDGDVVTTFEGETATRSISESGEYDVILTVSDTKGRSATETSALTIERGDDGSTGSSGGGGGSGTGGGGGGTANVGGSGAGTTGADDSGGRETTDSGSDADGRSEATDREREPIVSETYEIDDRFPNAPGTAVVFGETAIREIIFENRSVNGEISVEEFDGLADDAPPIPGEPPIDSVSTVTVPDEHRSSDALIRAVVSDEWIAKHDIEPRYLTVYRLPHGENRWEALPTEAFEIEGGYLVEAETPGFSTFVVAGRKPPSSANEGAVTSNDSGTASDEDTGGGGRSESVDPKNAASAETTKFDPTSPIVPLAFLGALLVVVAAVGRLFIPRRRKKW